MRSLLLLLLASLLCAGCVTGRRKNVGVAFSGLGGAVNGYGGGASAIFPSSRTEPRGYGVEFNANSLWPVFMIGAEHREYRGSVENDELYFGPKLYFSDRRYAPYLHLLLRYSPEIKSGPAKTGDFWGYGFGGGLDYLLTSWLYVDARIQYEAMFQEPTFPNGEKVGLYGLVGKVGLGFIF